MEARITSGTTLALQEKGLPDKMPVLLIKYYSFVSKGKKNTCYDGRCGFLHPKKREPKEKDRELLERFYPDEFLIAHILDKYLAAHPLKCEHRKIILLTEHWLGNGGTREGMRNTPLINEQILNTLAEYAPSEKQRTEVDSKEKNTLILVPFLYGYHHPGIAIDVKNKLAIYLDPKGWSTRYPETEALKSALIQLGFDFFVINTAQQSSDDSTSCGAILTASMIKFIEDFLKSGTITSNGFKANKKNLATDHMFQMYINNTVESKGRTPNLHETMLADENLWDEFFAEQGIDKRLAQLIIDVIRAHKSYIQELLGTIDPKKIQFIRNFQSRMIEFVLLQPKEVEKAKSLVEIGLKWQISNEDEISEQISTPPILMEKEHFQIIQGKLGLSSFMQSTVSLPSIPIDSTKSPFLAKAQVPLHSVGGYTLIDTFIEEHETEYKSSCFNRTNLTNLNSYETLTGPMVLAHAESATFFGCGFKNRTRLILEKMGVVDENGTLLKPEFKTAINNRKKV